MEKCHLRNFSSEPNEFYEIGGNASLSQGGWTPLSYGLRKAPIMYNSGSRFNDVPLRFPSSLF